MKIAKKTLVIGIMVSLIITSITVMVSANFPVLSNNRGSTIGQVRTAKAIGEDVSVKSDYLMGEQDLGFKQGTTPLDNGEGNSDGGPPWGSDYICISENNDCPTQGQWCWDHTLHPDCPTPTDEGGPECEDVPYSEALYCTDGICLSDYGIGCTDGTYCTDLGDCDPPSDNGDMCDDTDGPVCTDMGLCDEDTENEVCSDYNICSTDEGGGCIPDIPNSNSININGVLVDEQGLILIMEMDTQPLDILEMDTQPLDI